jgi:hypothetical protein
MSIDSRNVKCRRSTTSWSGCKSWSAVPDPCRIDIELHMPILVAASVGFPHREPDEQLLCGVSGHEPDIIVEYVDPDGPTVRHIPVHADAAARTALGAPAGHPAAPGRCAWPSRTWRVAAELPGSRTCNG